MKLQLQRNPSSKFSTTGRLSIDGLPECFTLEDVVRDAKISGETAIPAGTYAVGLHVSAHFSGRTFPILNGVRGFEGVLIHSGNIAADTRGCILVGRILGIDRVAESRVAYDRLFPKIKAALDAQEPVTIEVIPAPEES